MIEAVGEKNNDQYFKKLIFINSNSIAAIQGITIRDDCLIV